MPFSPPLELSARNQFYQQRYLSGSPLTEAMLNEEAEFAQNCLETRDFRRGLHAIGVAVGLIPTRQDWQEILKALFDAAGHDIDSVLEKGLVPGQANDAIRIYAAYRKGNFEMIYESLTTMCQQVPHSLLPEVWGIPWLTEDVMKTLGREVSLRFLVRFTQDRYPEPAEMTEFQCENLYAASQKVALLEQLFGSDSQTTLFRCQMLGKSRHFEEAKQVSRSAFDLSPTFNTATAVAMAHKRSGDRDGAVIWFRKAADIDPKCEWTLLDIGDMLSDAGDFAPALAAYEEAIQRVPNHDWATPSAVYCRYMLHKDPAHLAELRGMALANPCQCGLASQLKQLFGGYNYEDRRTRAEFLMGRLEPGFDAVALRGPVTECAHPTPEGLPPGEKPAKKLRSKSDDPKNRGWKK